MRSKLCPDVLWVHGVIPSMHDVFMKRIFHELLTVGIIVNARRIRFILGEKRRGFPLKGEADNSLARRVARVPGYRAPA